MNTVLDHTYGIYKAYLCNLDRHKWQLYFNFSIKGTLEFRTEKNLFIPKTKIFKNILATDSEKS